MAAQGSFLNGLGTLFGGAGNAGAAAGNAWQYGQYQPFNVNNPMGQISFNGTTANASLSPLQQQLQQQFGGLINNNFASGANVYNPNTGFLPQQYQSIYGPGFQNNVNTQFNALQQAQAPWLAQQRSSNLDNEFSKGTLASTAGQYQTAGFDQAANSLMQQNQNTAFSQASNLANQQFGAAQGTAGLMEQQAQFRPQIAMGQDNSAFNNLLGQGGLFNQTLGLGGQLGSQRSLANIGAATPGIYPGTIQDQASAGLLSGLLFGGGTQGGLLQSLLGTGQQGGGALAGLGAIGSKAGGLLGSITGGGTPTTAGGGYTNPGTGGSSYGGDPNQTFTQDPTMTSGGDGGTTTWWGDGGFNGAGGQAANGLPDYSNPDNLAAQNPNLSFDSGGGGNALGAFASTLGAGGGFLQGIARGGGAGDVQAASSLAKVYGNLTGNAGVSQLGGELGGALGVYNGIQQGGVAGDTSAAISAAQLGAQTGLFGAASGAVGAIAGPAGLLLGVGELLNNTTPVSENKSWWDNISKGVQAGPGADKNNPAYFNAMAELASMVNSNNSADKSHALQTAQELGINPSTLVSSYTGYAQNPGHKTLSNS